MVDIKFLAMCVIIMQISNLFEFYKIKEEIRKLKEIKNDRNCQ